MQVPLEQVQDLRKRFFDKLHQEYNNGQETFHPFDIDRVKSSDFWLQRFLIHHDLDIKEAFNMLWETCEWRKSNNVNEINEGNLVEEYLKEGALFPHGLDKDGKPMLLFKCKMHTKGSRNFEDLKRILIYWFERLDRQYNGDQITIFFDMTDTGLSNMDMEFTKVIISLNKCYYPHFLNYILIFEMPWVLNAAFKIIKSWLPAKAVQKIKFINKQSLKEYVDPKNILTGWGGDDDYTFSFTPEIKVELESVSSPTVTSSKYEDLKKKVHFTGVNGLSAENSPISSTFRDLKSGEENSVCSASLLNIIHPDTVYFNCIDGEYIGLINIENITNKPVLYKVKTTSPDRFRVRPSSGIILPGVSTKITVVVQVGFQINSIVKDKFLVMSMITDKEEATPLEVIDIWKQAEGVRVEQHRLKCSVIEPVTQTANGSSNSAISEEIINKMDQLKTEVFQMRNFTSTLHKDLIFRQNMVTSVLVLLLMLVTLLLYFNFRTHASSSSSEDDHLSSAIIGQCTETLSKPSGEL